MRLRCIANYRYCSSDVDGTKPCHAFVYSSHKEKLTETVLVSWKIISYAILRPSFHQYSMQFSPQYIGTKTSTQRRNAFHRVRCQSQYLNGSNY